MVYPKKEFALYKGDELLAIVQLKKLLIKCMSVNKQYYFTAINLIEKELKIIKLEGLFV